MAKIPCFEASHLEAACKVLADTTSGLTGKEISHILQEIGIADIDPDNTKWKRLFNALADAQNKHQVGNHLVLFINKAMAPVRHVNNQERFDFLRDDLNVVLAFSGYQVNDSGQVIHASRETTLAGAKARAGKLVSLLKARGTHAEIFKYCRAELLEDNYFHAVFESVKGLAERIRILSGLTSDGADLIQSAFLGNSPIIAFNSLQTETERSEQKGIANLMIGLFGAVRNPTAHAPKIVWVMPEQDAIDILALVSFIHRKLDNALRA